MIKKMINKIIVTTLVLTLLFSFPLTAMKAVAGVVPGENKKDENIYSVLNPNGQVNNIYVVNSFELANDATITDYGEYESLRNLSSTQKLSNQDGKVTTAAAKGRFYYQGNLVSKELPWKIEIKYKLDRQEIDPAQLIGKSGQVEISIHVTKNDKVNQEFADHFTMQISVSLDGNKFHNITADGATIANAGNNKILNYTLLPGNEKTFIMKADTEKFELNPIQFNGVLLAMDISPDNVDTLTGDFKSLSDGINKLNNGADQLKDGSKEYSKGLNSLADHSKDITKSSSAIEGALSNTSNGLSELVKSSQQLKDLANAMLQSPDPQTQALAQGYLAQAKALEQIAGGLTTLSGQYKQFDGGLEQFSDGVYSLKDGYKELNKGIGKLSNGTQELYDNTSDMDVKMQDKIDSMLSDFSNKDYKPVSYVSENNKNVGTVQFVIRTDALEIPEVKTVVKEETVQLTFWEKLLKLFGL